MNVAMVMGTLSSAPRVTELGSGDVLVRYEVTVARDDGPADSVPVSWVGPTKQAPPTGLERGDGIVVVGRVRRRWYRAGSGHSTSATEVVAERVARTGDRRRAAAVLAWAADAVVAQVDAGPAG